MASAAVETYEDLQADYERKLREYEQAESHYSRAKEANPDDPALKQPYEELKARRQELTRLYERAREMRSNLASQRDQALSRAAAR